MILAFVKTLTKKLINVAALTFANNLNQNSNTYSRWDQLISCSSIIASGEEKSEPLLVKLIWV